MKIEDIKKEIEIYFDVDLTSRTRKKQIVWYRFLYYHLCIKYASVKTTYEKIGTSIGFHHAMVIYGNKEFEYICKHDKDFNESVNHFINLKIFDKDVLNGIYSDVSNFHLFKQSYIS